MESSKSSTDAADNMAQLFTEGESSGFSEAARKAYEDARISGLCHEGALEVALSRVNDGQENEQQNKS